MIKDIEKELLRKILGSVWSRDNSSDEGFDMIEDVISDILDIRNKLIMKELSTLKMNYIDSDDSQKWGAIQAIGQVENLLEQLLK